MKIDRIPLSEDHLKQLQGLIGRKDDTGQNDFVMKPLTDEELLLRRRCLGCGKALSQLKGRQKARANQTPATNDAAYASPAEAATPQLIDPAKPAPTPQFMCKFHPGEVIQKYWTCCDQHCTADPCSGADFHDPHDEPLSELSRRYQLHYTPIVHGRHGPQDVRAAVALDCEMGTAKNGDSELIKITLIDYFSGEILLNNIVEPDVPMQHLNTRYSGITWGQMRNAQRKRTCLKATKSARNAVWTYVDENTIVVGHGVNNDLRALKWIHENVVDSMVIERNKKKKREEKETLAKEEADTKAKAEGTYVEPVEVEAVPGRAVDGSVASAQKKKKKKSGDLSLKFLADARLGRKIQLGDGTTGHDSLEDAVAARDLVHWHIAHADAE